MRVKTMIILGIAGTLLAPSLIQPASEAALSLYKKYLEAFCCLSLQQYHQLFTNAYPPL